MPAGAVEVPRQGRPSGRWYTSSLTRAVGAVDAQEGEQEDRQSDDRTGAMEGGAHDGVSLMEERREAAPGSLLWPLSHQNNTEVPAWPTLTRGPRTTPNGTTTWCCGRTWPSISDVRGCMVIKPHGYAIWEKMQAALDGMFKATGHVNAYFRCSSPRATWRVRPAMWEGFAKECAVVTHWLEERSGTGRGGGPRSEAGGGADRAPDQRDDHLEHL